MAKVKLYPELEVPEMLLADRRSAYGLRTYVSLFSSAGVGCYGFKEEGFYCVATVELLERRLKIQKFNQKCVYNSGYICGDITCLLYTSDAADERTSVDLGGRRIIKKKNNQMRKEHSINNNRDTSIYLIERHNISQDTCAPDTE